MRLSQALLRRHHAIRVGTNRLSLFRSASTSQTSQLGHPHLVPKSLSGTGKDETTLHRILKPQFERAYCALGLTSLDGWYTVTGSTLAANGVQLGVSEIGMLEALQVVYPDHTWQPWRLRKVPTGYWHSIEHCREFFLWAYTEMGLETLNDWYTIDTSALRKLGCAGMLRMRFDDRLSSALVTCFPEHEWHPWKFAHLPNGWWKRVPNQKLYFDWLFKELKYESMDDWYRLSVAGVRKHYGGSMLLNYYKDSTSSALAAVYPDHEWLPWQFKRSPKSYWASLENQRTFMEWVKKQLGLSKLDDWYSVKVQQVQELGGVSLVKQYDSSLIETLKAVYPDYQWDPYRFDKVSTMHLRRTKQSADNAAHSRKSS